MWIIPIIFRCYNFFLFFFILIFSFSSSWMFIWCCFIFLFNVIIIIPIRYYFSFSIIFKFWLLISITWSLSIFFSTRCIYFRLIKTMIIMCCTICWITLPVIIIYIFFACDIGTEFILFDLSFIWTLAYCLGVFDV